MSHLQTNYDKGKIFLFGNRFFLMTYTNTTGAEVIIPRGRLIGRITSSQKAWPHASNATDGSEQPIGVCGDDYKVAAGATIQISVCDGGKVDSGKIVLGGSDTLATVVARTLTDSGTDTVTLPGASIRDLIVRNTQIELVTTTDHTGFDNQL